MSMSMPTGARDAPVVSVNALEYLPVPTVQCTQDYVVLQSSRSFRDLFCPYGIRPEGQNLSQFVLDADGTPVDPTVALAQLAPCHGSLIWVQISMALQADLTGPTCFIQFTDIDALKRREERIAHQETIWRTAVTATGQGVWEFYAPTDSRFYSNDWKRIRGIPSREEVVDSHEDWMMRIHPDDRDRLNAEIARHHASQTSVFAYEYRELRRDGEYVWISSRGDAIERYPDGTPRRVIGTDFDITDMKREEERRASEAEENYRCHLAELETARRDAEAARLAADAQAQMDSLTGLANRRAFAERLDGLTERPNLAAPDFALLLVDLDRFKPVNDTHGHGVGDNVICTVAQRMSTCIGEADLVARIGGDEFGVIVAGSSVGLRQRAEQLAGRIISQIGQPIEVDGLDVEIGASIGITLFPENALTPTTLLRTADIALYHVKHSRRGGHAFYHPEMDQKRILRARLEDDVRRAVKTEAIKPWFQPLVDLRSGQITGFEVLARWTHPEHGALSPSQFIPIIEQFELTREFGLSMLHRACRVALDWPADCALSYNVSARGISDAGLPGRVLQTLEDEGFPPERLIIEVSEKAMVNDLDTAQSVIERLRDAGVQIALDDFGVGYSGLSYLQRLSFDILKLDRSFIMAMADCDMSRRIVMSVLSLAEEFGMKTVAEGIEDQVILSKVAAAGFDVGQGYLFSKAVPAAQATAMLRNPPDLGLAGHYPVVGRTRG